jgi:hypothetical protein
MVPAGLRRCPQCGSFRGTVLGEAGFFEVRCLCDGIVCRVCRERAIPRPISTRYDEETGRFLHVPWFGYLVPCSSCREVSSSSP